MLSNSCMEKPFFKPLKSAASNSHLRHQDQHGKQNQFFAPVRSQEHKSQQKISEPDQHGTERLSLLHTRLHQEAEKIMKWKVQTEIDLKQRDRKITEAKQTVDSLRKSVLDLQLQNENLSMKLQEELENREEILQKINSTRDMCTLLKDHAAKLEDKLQKCESDKTQFRFLNVERVKHFDELTCMFKNLEIAAKDNHDKLTNKVKLVQAEKQSLEKDITAKLNESEASIKMYAEQCQVKDGRISAIITELENNKLSISDLATEQCKLQEKLQFSEDTVGNQKAQLETVCQELCHVRDAQKNCQLLLETTENKLANLTESKGKMEKNFDESERLYMEKVKSLKDEICQITDNLNAEQSRCKEIEFEYQQSQLLIEEHKAANDVLSMQKKDAEDKVSKLESVKISLLKNKDSLSANLTTALGERDNFSKQVQHLSEEKILLEKQIESLNHEIVVIRENVDELNQQISDREEQLIIEKNEVIILKEDLVTSRHKEKNLQEQLNTLKSQIENQSEEASSVNKLLSTMQHESKDLKKELNGSKKEITKLSKEIQKHINAEADLKDEVKRVDEQNKSLSLEVENFQSTLQEKKDKIESLLHNEASNAKSLEDELHTSSKKATSMENQIKNLKSDNAAKKQQMKDLEKELKALKKEITASSKSSNNLEEKSKDLIKELQEYEDKFQNLEKSYGKEQEVNQSLQALADNLKVSLSKSVQEKEEDCGKFNSQLSEMMAAIEKYKRDGQAMVSQKDIELEELKKKMNSLELKYREKEDSENKLKEENKNLYKKREEAESGNSSTSLRINELCEEIKLLKNSVDKKNKEIERWKKDNGVLNSKKKELEMNAKLSATTLVPQTPRGNSKIVSNLKTPKKGDIASTPKVAAVMATPKAMCTPSRGILKPQTLSAKKRRVIFAGSEDDTDRGSETSTSECMEVALDSYKSKMNDKSTPLLIRPSPRVVHKAVKSPTALKPVPRGLSAQILRQKKARVEKGAGKLVHNLNVIQREHETFIEEKAKGRPAVKKQKSPANMPNIRKTPQKANAYKFFKTRSPKDYKPQMKENIAWFDSDAVFGFGNED